MTVVEFLEERLVDTIATAREVQAQGVTDGLDPADPRVAALRLARVTVADVEAKRQIVALHQLAEGPTYRQTECCARCTATGEYPADDAYTDEQNWPCPTLRALAAVYADHPDYDQAWAL